MLTHTGSNARFYRSLLGLDGVSGAQAGAFRALDQRPIGHGSLFCSAHPNGRVDVFHAKTQPTTARSDAGETDAMAPSHLHLFLPLVPRRSGPLLGGQQLAVDGATICHNPAY